MNYAQNLLDIYVNLVKPFLDENAKYLEKISIDFTRFFIFRNPIVQYPEYGKSFTNLDSSHGSQPHFPFGASVALNDYYMSHFRNVATFSNKNASIDAILFDFNYFFCYFQPIFERLKKNI